MCNILSSNKNYDHYKDKVFPVGECLHAKIKDAAHCITFIPIKPNNIVHIKCAMGFCAEWHK